MILINLEPEVGADLPLPTNPFQYFDHKSSWYRNLTEDEIGYFGLPKRDHAGQVTYTRNNDTSYKAEYISSQNC
jgi:hypothetical protein